MNKLYNSFSNITRDFNKFLQNIFINSGTKISKPNLKLIAPIVIGMITAESIVTSDIAKKLKGDFSHVQHSSNIRRIERFFNNKKFNPYECYSAIISNIISNYKLKNENVYIAFDHMYCRDDFTIFLISLRIGKQGLPLYFKCFKGNNNPAAFDINMINEGISYVYNLFKDKKCKLIFLADRWFNHCAIMKHIESLSCTYCIRTKTNLRIHIENYEYSDLIEHISDIEATYSKSKYFENVTITENQYPTKLVISKSKGHKEPFYILTNGRVQDAVKHYGYRFGAIEFIFKNDKSNGFYLECTQIRNIHAFTTLFTMTCIAMLWLTTLGIQYSSLKNQIATNLKIRTSKKNGQGKKIIISLFNVGLIWFSLLYQSEKYLYPLKCDIILRDV